MIDGPLAMFWLAGENARSKAALTPSLPEASRLNGMMASGPASPINPAPLANGKSVGRSTI
ncbi:hypothetical protein D3C86_2122840 [compost metagenome]